MKLEKYVDKDKKRRKAVLISLGVIVLISVSLLLYKTFASFTESAEFPMMKGKVDYFGNSDIYFAFYKGDEQLEEMPQKNNNENLVFERGECDKGASIEWNSEEWAPLVKGLNKVKTKCSLYFKEQEKVEIGGMKVPVTESGDGLYAIPHDDLEELGQEWNRVEYRYAGVDPDNYVSFNNEIWRIIGLVNVKTASGVEQRLKIVRTDGVKEQKDFGKYYWDISNNNWITSKLKDMLNGIYYESGIGDCYSSSSASQCDFNKGTDLPKGLDETARNMIDKEVIWNLGGWADSDITTRQFYEKERGTAVYNTDRPTDWSSTTEVGGKHNGIGLIYPSDYGYAVGGEVRNNCLAKDLWFYDEGNCKTNDWLKPNNFIWTLSPRSSYSNDEFGVGFSGFVAEENVYSASWVWPVGYLISSTKIVDGSGDINSPFVLSLN